MASFFKNKSKIVFLIFGILIAAFMIYAMSFMTAYSHIHVVYKIEDGIISFPTTSGKIPSTNVANLYINRYFNNSQSIPAGLIGGSFVETYAKTIYDFNNSLNAFNDFLVAVGIVSIVALAVMFIFSNNSRRIYYKSNLIVGVLASLTIIVMSIIAIAWTFTLMGQFNENETLYKVVSVIQNPVNQGQQAYSTLIKPDCDILSMASGTNVIGFVVAMLFSLVLAGFAVFVIVFTIGKYKRTANERKEIIERAVAAND